MSAPRKMSHPAMGPPPPAPNVTSPLQARANGGTAATGANGARRSDSQQALPQTLHERFIDLLRACRGSRKLVLLIVAVALLLDNMLLTSVGESHEHLRRFFCARHQITE